MIRLPRIHSKLGEVLYSVIDGADTVVKIMDRLPVKTKHSTIMEHLSKLEHLGILSGTKKGRERVYSVNWNSLIDEFATDFIYNQEWLTDMISADVIVGKRSEKVVAHLPFVSPVIARRFGEKKYIVEERPLLIQQIARIMKTNGLVRNFIEEYIKAYASLYWMEPSATLPRCIFEFEEWFLQLASENTEVKQLMHSKPADKQMRDFLKFLDYLIGHTYVTGINRFVCTEAMKKFIVDMKPRITSRHQ
jgi:hypothetical protein